MPKFAQRMYDMEGSASVIRALFGAMGDANIISFGGGAPASEGLPVEEIRDICTDVLTRGKRGVVPCSTARCWACPTCARL